MFSDSQNQFESLVCLDTSDNAGKRTDGSSFCTSRNESWFGWCRKLTTVARTTIEIEYSYLSFELIYCTKYKRNPAKCTRIIY